MFFFQSKQGTRGMKLKFNVVFRRHQIHDDEQTAVTFLTTQVQDS